jgi:hypothetical protein
MSTGAGLAGDGSKNRGGDHRFQILIALIGVTGAIIAAVIGLKPWSHSSASSGPSTSPSPTGRCVFLTPSNVVCTSSNPVITIEFNNEVSSVGCTLRAQVNWGDGSPMQTFNFEGGPKGPFVLGDHKYGHKGVYSISATSMVADQCSSNFNTFPGSYSFTLS